MLLLASVSLADNFVLFRHMFLEGREVALDLSKVLITL